MSNLTSTSDEFLLCRTLGHAWKPTFVGTTKGHRGKVIEYRPHLVCLRCETTKAMILSPTGDLGGSRYSYPDGYLQRGEEARFRRQDIRSEFLRRYVPREA